MKRYVSEMGKKGGEEEVPRDCLEEGRESQTRKIE